MASCQPPGPGYGDALSRGTRGSTEPRLTCRCPPHSRLPLSAQRSRASPHSWFSSVFHPRESPQRCRAPRGEQTAPGSAWQTNGSRLRMANGSRTSREGRLAACDPAASSRPRSPLSSEAVHVGTAHATGCVSPADRWAVPAARSSPPALRAPAEGQVQALASCAHAWSRAMQRRGAPACRPLLPDAGCPLSHSRQPHAHVPSPHVDQARRQTLQRFRRPVVFARGLGDPGAPLLCLMSGAVPAHRLPRHAASCPLTTPEDPGAPQLCQPRAPSPWRLSAARLRHLLSCSCFQLKCH